MAFGQPAWEPWLAYISSLFGYALFWRVLLDLPSGKQRFWLSTGWFAGVQGVQISWMLMHPYSYILSWINNLEVVFGGFGENVISAYLVSLFGMRPSKQIKII